MHHINKYFNAFFLIQLSLFIFSTVSAQSFTHHTIKKNITSINSPLKSLLKLEPRVFEYNSDMIKAFRLKEGRQYGFLAENMHAVFPGMVSSKNYSYMYGKNSYRDIKIQTIDEVSLIPVLVASIQELHQEIEQLKLEIKDLKK